MKFSALFSLLLLLLWSNWATGALLLTPEETKFQWGWDELEYQAKGDLKRPAALPAKPAAVTFTTGVPLHGAGDTTGGFGDVASNIIGALEYKRRNPGAVVNVVVTSMRERPRPSVRTTHEIMKVMLPELNSDFGAPVQAARGINFYFPSIDAEALVNGNFEGESLAKQLPSSDLSVQLSANNNPIKSVMRRKTGLALHFYELGLSENVLVNHAPRSTAEFGPVMGLTTGFESTGAYLEAPDAGARARLEKWLAETHGHQLDPKTKILFAYSSEAEATKFYQAAVSELVAKDPQTKYLLVTKDFGTGAATGLPPNLANLQTKGMPHEVLKALIQESALSPLVTGDSSLSLALSLATPEKSFVYEAPTWKQGSAQSLRNVLRSGGVPWDQMESSILSQSLAGDPDWAAKARELADTIGDRKLQAQVFQAIQDAKPRMDLQNNLQKIYELHRLYQTELDNRLTYDAFFEFGIRQWVEAKDARDVLDRTGKILSDRHAAPGDRIHAGLLQLKLADQMTPASHADVWRAFAEMPDFEAKRVGLLLAPILERPVVQEFLREGLSSADDEIRSRAHTVALHVVKTFPELKPQLRPAMPLGKATPDCDGLYRAMGVAP